MALGQEIDGVYLIPPTGGGYEVDGAYITIPPQIVDGIVLGKLAPVIGAVIGIVSVVPIDSIVSSSAGRSMTVTTSGRSATVTTSDRSMIKEIN